MKALTVSTRKKQFIKRIDKILDEPTKDILKDFKGTAINFRQVTPEFIFKKHEAGGNVIVAIGVYTGPYKNPASDEWIYAFLLDGTKVRYAQLSDDWQSGTTPNKMATEQATGEMTSINISDPQPGIQARNWHKIIAAARQKDINSEAAQVFRNAGWFREN